MWDMDAQHRARAAAISIHGDEGTGKRGKSLLVLSWSPVGLSGTDHKYPFAVSPQPFIKVFVSILVYWFLIFPG